MPAFVVSSHAQTAVPDRNDGKKIYFSYTCGLTKFGKRSPFNLAIKFCAAIQDIISREILLALVMWHASDPKTYPWAAGEI